MTRSTFKQYKQIANLSRFKNGKLDKVISSHKMSALVLGDIDWQAMGYRWLGNRNIVKLISNSL